MNYEIHNAEYQTLNAPSRKCGTKYIRTFKRSDSDIRNTSKQRERKKNESILYRKYLCRESARVIPTKIYCPVLPVGENIRRVRERRKKGSPTVERDRERGQNRTREQERRIAAKGRMKKAKDKGKNEEIIITDCTATFIA